MRRDVGYYIPADIERVYNAYLMAATNPPFERSCHKEPFHTISFGVNYSFKYNMNGGSCNIHFMPSGNGTAVIIRFSLAQATGARYEKYAQELNKSMQRYLPVTPQEANYNIDNFLRPENQVVPAMRQNVVIPPQATASAVKFCPNCGTPITSGGRFCHKCGTEVPVVVQKACPKCGTVAKSDDAFCGSCGTRL